MALARNSMTLFTACTDNNEPGNRTVGVKTTSMNWNERYIESDTNWKWNTASAIDRKFRTATSISLFSEAAYYPATSEYFDIQLYTCFFD